MVDSLVDVVAAPYWALVAGMGILGLRDREGVALRTRHVDALGSRLIVEECLAEASGHFIFGPTKSHARRSVPLSPARPLLLTLHSTARAGTISSSPVPRVDLCATGTSL